MDKSALFLNPVSQEEVPDYYDVIKEPMSWSQMEDKLDRMAYLNVSDVKVRYLRYLSTDFSVTFYSFWTTPWYTTSLRRPSTVPRRE